MTTDTVSQPGPLATPQLTVLRTAVAAYLARYQGMSRSHTDSDLRVFLRWCAERDLDPLAARRIDPVGSALDNVAAESFFFTLEHELLPGRQFHTQDEARHVLAGWIDGFYNRVSAQTATGHRT